MFRKLFNLKKVSKVNDEAFNEEVIINCNCGESLFIGARDDFMVQFDEDESEDQLVDFRNAYSCECKSCNKTIGCYDLPGFSKREFDNTINVFMHR